MTLSKSKQLPRAQSRQLAVISQEFRRIENAIQHCQAQPSLKTDSATPDFIQALAHVKEKIQQLSNKSEGYSSLDGLTWYSQQFNTLRQILDFQHLSHPDTSASNSPTEAQAKDHFADHLITSELYALLSETRKQQVMNHLKRIERNAQTKPAAALNTPSTLEPANGPALRFNSDEHSELEASVHVPYYDTTTHTLKFMKGKDRTFDRFYYIQQHDGDPKQAELATQLINTGDWQGVTAAQLITLMDFWWINNKNQMTTVTDDQIQRFYAQKPVTINAHNKQQFLSGIRECAEHASLNRYDLIKDILHIDWLPSNVRQLLVMITDHSYLSAISNNYDHFYPHALFCYQTGHELAVDMMIKASQLDDPKAKAQYVDFAAQLEAYAQHTFTDCYAGGHLVIDPRKRERLKTAYHYLGSIVDTLTNYEHNVMNHYGVATRVTDKNGNPHYVICYGDDHLKAGENQRAMELCVEGLNLGYQQLREAFEIGKRPDFKQIKGYFPHVLTETEYAQQAQAIKQYFTQHKLHFDNKDANTLYNAHRPIAPLLRFGNNDQLEIRKDLSDLNPANAQYERINLWRVLKIAGKVITGTASEPSYKPSHGQQVTAKPSQTNEPQTSTLNPSGYHFFSQQKSDHFDQKSVKRLG